MLIIPFFDRIRFFFLKAWKIENKVRDDQIQAWDITKIFSE